MVILMPRVQAQVAGDSIFNIPTVHNIYLSFSQPNYWDVLTAGKAFDDNNDTSTYVPATVTINGLSYGTIGVQFKGNSSYYNYPGNKKPFTLAFDEYVPSQHFNGLKKINLNNGYQDPTLMREKLFLDFLNENGLYAPRSNYAKLYINGSYWGLYLLVERVDKSFLTRRMGNKGGNLFKGDGTSPACATLKYHQSPNGYYNCYTLKTNEGANDWSDLIHLTYVINSTDNSSFKDSMETHMNTSAFIRAWAANNLFVSFDSYSFRYPHNYYVYHNEATGKFDWITWDVSTAFGLDVPASVSQIENYSVLYTTPPLDNHPFANRMLENDFYKERYLEAICGFVSQYFNFNTLNPKIDFLENLIKASYYSDPLKMYTNQNFDDNINNNITVNGINIPGLKSFIANRSAAVVSELSNLGITCDQNQTNLDCDSICTIDIQNDSINEGYVNVTVSNMASTGITYPIIKLINNNGDVVANQQGVFESYGLLPNSIQTFRLPTTFTPFPANWTGTVSYEDGLYHYSCSNPFPCNQNPASIKDNVQQAVFVSPNPAEDFTVIYLNKSTFPVKMSVVDISGRVLLQQTINSTAHTIDVSTLKSGIYIISLSGINLNTSYSIIKN